MKKPSNRDPIDFRGSGLDRRSFMAAATALGVTSIAGCAGEEGNGNGNGNGIDPGADDDDDDDDVDPGEPQHGGTLVVAMREPATGIDVHVESARPVFTALRQCVETLFMNSHEGEIVPHLAKDIEFEDDGLTWIMPLQEDAMFHPPYERPMEARDVVASWDRVMDPDVGSPRRDNFAIADSWEVIDEHTLQVNFDPDPVVGFTGSMEERGGEVVPEEHIPDDGSQIDPVGTGPFVFEEWEEREGLFFSRNDDYWIDDLPYVDEFILRPVVETSVRALELENEDVHVDRQPVLEQIPDYEEMDNIDVHVAPTQAGRNQFAINCALYEPGLDNRPEEPIPVVDSDIRRAIQHALDRQQIVDFVYSGFAEPNFTKYPPEYPWCEDYSGEYTVESDLDAAEQAIDEAGFDEPHIVVCTRAENEGEVGLSEVFSSNLRQAGFDVEEQVEETAIWTDKILGAEYDCRPGVGNVAPDPIIFDRGRYMTRPDEDDDDVIHHYVGGPDNRGWDVVEIFDEALRETDQDRRAELYQEAFNIIVDDGSYIMSAHHEALMASISKLHDVRAHPSIMHNNFQEVWFEDPEEFAD